MNQDISFGTFIKEHRRVLDLTQAELARRVGCATITIRKIEADTLRPSVQIAERLAMALAIPLEERADFIRLARIASLADPSPPPLPTPPVTAEEIGQEDLSGRAIRGYELGERIGSGGFGAVYRAVQPLVEREVAIKIILPQYANHPDFIRRFEAEAQLVARLEHPHIVPLYDYWREPGVAYLVMRLLRGGSLEQSLKQGPLPLETVVRLLEQIGLALHAAHRVGVIHRDIKPANVLLDEDQNAYLADFGIAKNLGNPNWEEQTQLGAIVGSPAYLSPEQIRAEPVRPQTDIYSLGIMLYELLTGHKPFRGSTPIAYLQQHLDTPLPSLTLHEADLPPALNSILERATAKNLHDRYPDVLAVLADVRRVLAQEGDLADLGQLALAAETEVAPTLLALSGLTNPYKGLRAFGEADAEDFFGRDTLIQQLLGRMAEVGDPATGSGQELARFLAVVGPSGSGKSSVVRAGLVPALRRGGLPGSENWFVVEFIPGTHPLEELEAALLRVAVNPPESLLAQLQESERGLLRAARRVLPTEPEVELVLVIDQFEEVFTLVTDETVRAHFLDSLVTVVLDPRSRVRVVITLRADFTDRPLQYVDFGELLRQRTEFVLPFTPDELEQAISGPAQRAGLTLEAGLVITIMREMDSQPGVLPLLQYTLTELFERREGRALTLSGYQASGGIFGALARRAEQLYDGLDEVAQEATRQLFLRLVTLGEGVEDTRRRVLRSELASLTADNRSQTAENSSDEESAVSGRPSFVIDEVIDQFGRYRLLTFDHDPVTRGPTVEVAHEALLREWGRLRTWLSESRADVRLQRLLAAATSEWLEDDRAGGFLLRGGRLDQFSGWATQTTVALTGEERAYLEASLAARQARRATEEARQRRELETAQKLAETEKARAETEQQRAAEQSRAAKRLRWLALGLALFLVAAIGAAWLALQQTNRAEQETTRAEHEARLSTARELAAASLSNLEIDPERSILLALQAITTTYAVDGTVLREAEEALHRAIPASRVRMTLTGHKGYVIGVDFSSDGSRLATASSDKTARIWDTSTGQLLFTLTGHTDVVNAVAFSPDGSRLATASDDKSIKIWDADSGQELMTLAGHSLGDALTGKGTSTGHSAGVLDVAFSPDGTRLATAGKDYRAIIWDAASGTELLTIHGHGNWVNEIAFSPDGTQLATASSDWTVGVWDTLTGDALLILDSHADSVNAVAFSPDGTLLATAGNDQTIRLWDANTGQELGTLFGHTSGVTRVTFNRDGTQLATAGQDQQVIGWDVATRREVWRLAGHTRGVWDVAFSPDGSRLASASDDGTAKIWDITPGQEQLTLSETGVANDVGSQIDFSPDGRQLATTGDDGQTVILWDAITGQEQFILAGHSDEIADIDFSPDGTRLATASGDHTVRIWDPATGQEKLKLAGHADWVVTSAFSPDGARLATAGDDKMVRIWDTTTGQELLSLSSHTDRIWSIAYSPDGERLATAGTDSTIRLWDTATGQELMTLAGHTDWVYTVAFSPDGKRLATGSSDTTVKLWDVATGQELYTLAGHKGQVRQIAYSPDGLRLATASYDGSVKLWDPTTGQELLTVAKGSSAVQDIAFSPGRTRLGATSYDGMTRVYVLPTDELITLGQSRLTRTWTEEECRQYLHVEVCPTGP